MKVFIVYCHPSKNSFTYEVKEAFIKGLESAGHSYEISDQLEAMKTVMVGDRIRNRAKTCA